MGKYTNLKSVLPAFEHPPDWQARVNEAKGAFIALGASELASAFAVAREEKQSRQQDLTNINCDLEALSQLIVEHLEGEALEKITTSSGDTVFIKSDVVCKVVDPVLLNAWIDNQGMEELKTIHHSRLNGLTKERLSQHKDAPPGVELSFRTSARILSRNNGGTTDDSKEG